MKIGLGTWTIGGHTEANPDNDDEKDINTIKYAITHGISHIDTAENYANGKCEELIGEAIKDFEREKLFIATKVHKNNLSYSDVIKSCKASAARLGVDYLDLYYVHKPNPNIPVHETVKALNELLESGLIKNVGLSNAGIETIKQYSQSLIKPIYAVQNQYSLVCRESQMKGVIEYCKEFNIQFFAWRPIKLSYPEKTSKESNADTYPIIGEIAKKYNKTNIQIAAKWLTQQKNVNVLFKSSNPKHIDEIIETENFKLSQDDWDKLDKEFPVQKSQSFIGTDYMNIL